MTTNNRPSSKVSDVYSKSKALEGLPVKFVSAMRTLFDILDEQKSGFIALADFEMYMRREREEDGSAVPLGIVESLRKVTPSSGQLSFERFCAGLKICLLRNQAERSRLDTSESTENQSETEDQSSRVVSLKKQRMKASPSPALSLPSRLDPPLTTSGPPKPPRFTAPEFDRRLGDGGTASDGELQSRDPSGGGSKKQPRRRENHSRRHTLQNGIDYGLLKRMKAVEEERDALMRGLQTVKRAEEWYQEQLASVQERMRNIVKTGGTPRPDTEITREKMVFQLARIDEVNQHINSLITADISFPLSMNLAIGGGRSGQRDPREMERQIARLKDQNKLLTEEVGRKSNSISVLDQEKSALIRELFQARSKLRQAELGDGETTFM